MPGRLVSWSGHRISWPLHQIHSLVLLDWSWASWGCPCAWPGPLISYWRTLQWLLWAWGGGGGGGGGSGGGPTAPSLPSLTGSTGGFPRRWATSISSRTSGGWSSRGGHYRRRVSCHQLTQPSPRGSRTHVLTPFVPTAPDRQLSLWGPRSPVWACRW